jgi:hypothetical protein
VASNRLSAAISALVVAFSLAISATVTASFCAVSAASIALVCPSKSLLVAQICLFEYALYIFVQSNAFGCQLIITSCQKARAIFF